MFAFLSQKAPGAENYKCTAISWNKETDFFVAGRSDGVVVMRQMDAKPRLSTNSTNRFTSEGVLKSEEQDLLHHQVAVRNIAWNPRHNIVATGDGDGVTTVWKLDPKSGIWENHMATKAVQSSVLGMEWTKEGDRICIIFDNGTVMVGKIDGLKLWSVELKHARIPAWSADGEVLLVATSLGQIFVYDKGANNVGLVKLTQKPDEKPSDQPLVDMKWVIPVDTSSTFSPGLAVAFQDGKCFLLRGEDDNHPVVFQAPLIIVCTEWSADGKWLAIGGRSRKSVAFPEEVAQLMIYSIYGKQEYTMRFRYKHLTNLAWDSGGQRMAVLLDGVLNFVTIKRSIKYCYFDNVLAYTCPKDENPDAFVVMYNTKTDRKVTVKHFSGQRVLCLAAGNDFCVLATKVIKEINQFNLYILSDTGTTVNVSFTSVEPVFAAANENQMFMASKEVIFVWSFRQSGNMESSSNRWESNERYFHVDDAHGYIDLKQKRQRLYEVSVDPICSIAASKDTLVVGRESGVVVRYNLPQMTWAREYPIILPLPRKMGMNKDSSRLLIMNYEGQCVMYALGEIKLAKDAPPVKDVKVSLEQRDIWDFVWADDDAEMFVIAQKSRAVVYRNREPEEPVANEGYFCRFKDLEVRVAYLDQIVRSLTPIEPPANCTSLFRVKSLRETHHFLETAPLTDAQQFVNMNPHTVLWNLVGDKAVQKLELDSAETCYIHGENYRGVQFVNRLRKSKSDQLRQAEIAAHFGDQYKAEQEYNDANRPDLACDMRRIAGDWFRLKELAEEQQSDSLKKDANEGFGNYYFDRQSWRDAILSYEAARDYPALFKCYMLNGDMDKLEQLADSLPVGHYLLTEIGQLLGRYGNSTAAARILKNAGRLDLAVQVCLSCYDFQTASEIVRATELEHYSSATVTEIMSKAIQDQIAMHADTNTALWNSANLYYNSGSFLEAAKCLFQILSVEAKNKQPSFLRLKKISVLAAVAVEEFRSSLNRPGPLNRPTGRQTELFQEEMKSVEYPFIDNCWHSAEAYNIMLIARKFYANQEHPKALRAAGTLCVYLDVLDPVDVFSMIALNGVHMKRWDVVNEAIMRVVSLDTTSTSAVEEMEQFADELFTKFSPKDVDTDEPLPSPICLNCKERLSIWDIKCQACGTKYPICMITGSPITEKEVWQCDFCHHHCAGSVALRRKVCALCHTLR